MAQKGASAGLSLAGKGFFGSLCAGTFGLGVWQTSRYFEKTDLVAERQDALARPPLTEFTTDRHGFHRMRLQGQYLYEKECLVGPRSPPVGALPDKPGSSGQGMARAPMGYYVLTPFQVDTTTNDKNKNNNQLDTNTILIVNRGWIPRHLVHKDEKQPQRQQQRQHAQSQPLSLVPSWDRPTGPVTVSCITMATEQPRIVVPEHKLHLNPPELFWMDVETLQKHVSSTTTASSSKTPVHVASLVTRVQEDDSDDSHSPHTTTLSFPVAPPAQQVGEFKTSPAIHAGYAATWYGLSMAGLYMTRMLILRK